MLTACGWNIHRVSRHSAGYPVIYCLSLRYRCDSGACPFTARITATGNSSAARNTADMLAAGKRSEIDVAGNLVYDNQLVTEIESAVR